MKRISLLSIVSGLTLLAGILLSGCGSGKSLNSTTTTTTNAANSLSLTVGQGTFANGYSNAPYATITICQPGSSNCTSLDHILIDTGSSGLRILSTELPSGFTLPNATVTGGSLYECLPFLDSYTWGNLVNADLELAGEKASSLAVQMITSLTAPTTCSSTIATAGSPAVTSEATLGARGILGIGNFQADCGGYCAASPVQSMDLYFACSSSAASSCSQAAVSVAKQVSNPVGLFASDNNGVIFDLPSVAAGGVSSVTGTLYFGIGTQSNNTPPSGLTVLNLDGLGDFVTTFQSNSMPFSFLDTGSNGFFFGTIDSSLKTSTGITGCNLGTSANPQYWYCPTSEASESATLTGAVAPVNSTGVSFQVGNAQNLLGGALSDLAGPNVTTVPHAATSFDWGLPFFFGRRVYVGLEGSSSSLGSGLYDAF
jgi:Protein of unknown function (DUF3443)